MSTTMVFVRLLSALLNDREIGKHIVPIVADEARTFGMQTLFRQGRHLLVGRATVRTGRPGADLLLQGSQERSDSRRRHQRSRRDFVVDRGGHQLSANGVPMLPFYIFYSMFGFQRVGDLVWAAADSRTRGFLLGATAGRTTLVGRRAAAPRRLQPPVRSTIPNCGAYDPCFGYELALILRDGMRRMLVSSRMSSITSR